MSKFFIRRPIVAIVIAILTVIVGIVAMLSLPTAQYPDIVPPEIMVQATYPGADAKTLAQAVATPIEQQMNGVDNMLYMSSVSAKKRPDALYGDFRVKNQRRYRSGAGAASRRPGGGTVTGPSECGRNCRTEVAQFASDGCKPHFT